MKELKKNEKYLKATLQKDYYKKAKEVMLENGGIELVSYGTRVCRINKDGSFVKIWNGYSRTTMKHINDFRLQHGLDLIWKKEWDGLNSLRREKWAVEFNNYFINKPKRTMVFDNKKDAENYMQKLIDSRSYGLVGSFELVQLQ